MRRSLLITPFVTTLACAGQASDGSTPRVAAADGPAAAAAPVPGDSAGNRDRLLARTGIGVGIRLTVATALRDQTRALYAGPLGGTLKTAPAPNEDRDYFRFPNGTRVVVFYVSPGAAPAPNQIRRTVRLEFGVPSIPAAVASLTTLAAPEVRDPDGDRHRYFQAPGGQVFRLSEVTPSDTGMGVAHELDVARDLRDTTRLVYCEILGATLTNRPRRPDTDFFSFKNGTRLAAHYSDPSEVQDAEPSKAGAWLEMKVDSVPTALEAFERLRIRPFAYDVDPQHEYVQAPGGQVLRLLDASE